MKITFLTPAERELDEAFDYYEAQKPGLGFEFIEEGWLDARKPNSHKCLLV